jgi:DNA invertase Pin-like site-specific DNA recombinase
MAGADISCNFEIFNSSSSGHCRIAQRHKEGDHGVIAVKNGLDSQSSSGRMMLKMIGLMEEWNREMLIERTNAGLARTVANGTKLGRKSVLTPSSKRTITTLRDNGLSIQKIADEIGINRGAVQRFLKAA